MREISLKLFTKVYKERRCVSSERFGFLGTLKEKKIKLQYAAF